MVNCLIEFERVGHFECKWTWTKDIVRQLALSSDWLDFCFFLSFFSVCVAQIWIDQFKWKMLLRFKPAIFFNSRKPIPFIHVCYGFIFAEIFWDIWFQFISIEIVLIKVHSRCKIDWMTFFFSKSNRIMSENKSEWYFWLFFEFFFELLSSGWHFSLHFRVFPFETLSLSWSI